MTLYYLQNVRYLNLSHNNISKFEDGWHHTWLRLRWLGLSYNNFSGPLETESLNFIKYDNNNFWIDLSNNNFTRVVISNLFAGDISEQTSVQIDLRQNPFLGSPSKTTLSGNFNSDNDTSTPLLNTCLN